MSQLAIDIASKSFNDKFTPFHQQGPDYIIPSEECRTWIADGATKIEISEKKDANLKPQSVVSFFRSTVDKIPHNTALAVKRNNEWMKWSYMDYWNDVCVAARGLIKLGLEPKRGVGILGFNSPEWVITHLATIFAGGFSAGIYTTNSPDACYHILNDCSANIVVVENELQLLKVLSIKDSLPNLKAIVQYLGQPAHPNVLSWEDLLYIGRSLPEEVLERRIRSLAANQCFCLIYTSGTTGNPKGVMISHDNITFAVNYIAPKAWVHNFGKDTYVSFLPLSHIAALGSDVYTAVKCGAAVYFATPDALKGKLIDTLLEVQPNNLICVPRIYEKIYEKMQVAEAAMPPAKRKFFAWARKQALKYHTFHKLRHQGSEPLTYLLAKKLVLNKVKGLMGFQRLQGNACGGAPVSVEMQKYFMGLDLPIVEIYGLSETSGPMVLNTMQKIVMGSVGNINTLPEMHAKILNPDEQGNGEILLKGRNVFMGYLQLKEQTLEAIDEDHWYHTGDTGKIDTNGNLFITGRIKELIITSGGENIPPIIIEDYIKQILPIVSQCVLIGDKRKYLTMLITLKTDMNLETMEPLDTLSPYAVNWCRSIGSQAERVSEVLKTMDPHVMNGIQSAIDYYNNNQAISSAQKIQKWKILPKDFSLVTGEMGPTGKLKRQFIVTKFATVIESLYS